MPQCKRPCPAGKSCFAGTGRCRVVASGRKAAPLKAAVAGVTDAVRRMNSANARMTTTQQRADERAAAAATSPAKLALLKADPQAYAAQLQKSRWPSVKVILAVTIAAAGLAVAKRGGMDTAIKTMFTKQVTNTISGSSSAPSLKNSVKAATTAALDAASRYWTISQAAVVAGLKTASSSWEAATKAKLASVAPHEKAERAVHVAVKSAARATAVSTTTAAKAAAEAAQAAAKAAVKAVNEATTAATEAVQEAAPRYLQAAKVAATAAVEAARAAANATPRYLTTTRASAIVLQQKAARYLKAAAQASMVAATIASRQASTSALTAQKKAAEYFATAAQAAREAVNAARALPRSFERTAMNTTAVRDAAVHARDGIVQARAAIPKPTLYLPSGLEKTKEIPSYASFLAATGKLKRTTKNRVLSNQNKKIIKEVERTQKDTIVGVSSPEDVDIMEYFVKKAEGLRAASLAHLRAGGWR